MPRIESYAFGELVVGGRRIVTDVMMLPDGRMQDNWRRVDSHTLVAADISALLDAAPDMLIVGTGVQGELTLGESLSRECDARRIELNAMPTPAAVALYNTVVSGALSVAACFHLTC